MSKIKFPFAILALLLGSSISGQSNFLHGALIDVDTQEEIPFAHFRIIGTTEGFISNNDGEFLYYPIQIQETYKLHVSAIGYQSDTLTVSNQKKVVLQLQPSKIRLSEVVVIAKDYERELMKQIIEAIPANYPKETEKIQGEIWEKGYVDSLYTEKYYEANAKIEATKAGYGSSSTFGPVKLIEGDIETTEDYQKMEIRIAAGIHNVHRFDFVLQRLGPLNKSQLKNYFFEIVDTLQSDNVNIYDIYFEGKEYYGHLLVQEGSLAVLRGEFNEQPDKLNATPDYKRLFLKFTTEYTAVEGVHRLSYINYRTGFASKLSKEKFYLDNIFSLNRHSEEGSSIPFNEQVQFSDILAFKLTGEKGNYDLDSTFNSAQAFEQFKPKGYKTFQFISRMYSLFSIRYSPIEVSSSTVDVTSTDQFSANERSVVQYRLYSELGYEFSNTFKIGLVSEFAGMNRSFIGTTARWDFPLNARGSIIASVGGSAGYGQLRELMGTYRPEAPFEINNKRFTRKSADIFAETRAFEIAPGFGLHVQISPRGYLGLSGNYWLQIDPKNGYFWEQDKKRAFSSDQLPVSQDTPFLTNSWSLGISFNRYF